MTDFADLILIQPSILKFVDFASVPDKPRQSMLIMELCTWGSLQVQINEMVGERPRGLKADFILGVMAQISSALMLLHSQGFSHGDVKPHNILVRKLEPLEVVLGDFANVQHKSEKTRSSGTPGFMAPEIAKSHIATTPYKGDRRPGDMWALGVTLLAMMGLKRRYMSRNNSVMYREYQEQVQGLAYQNPGHKVVTELLAPLLTEEKNDRPKATDCKRQAESLIESDEYGLERLDLIVDEDFVPDTVW